MVTDEMVRRAATEYLSHRGERPYRVTRRGAELWEDHAPAMRAALEAALSAAEPVKVRNDDVGFVDFLNADRPYICRKTEGTCYLLIDRETGDVVGYRKYDDEAIDTPAPSVAVKALEWKEGEGGLKGQYVWSSGDPWVFWIVKNPDNPDYVWCENFGLEGWDPCSPVRGAFPTLEEAKAAAQADYDARIRSALSAQVQDVAGWKDISTAPRDGSDLLLSAASWHGDVVVGCWSFEGWRDRDDADPLEPTHWMALPAAPANQDGGESKPVHNQSVENGESGEE